MRFLDLFRDPRGWFARNSQQQPSFYISSSLTQILESAYPELARNRPLYELIAQDLEARKLFGGGMHTMMSANGAWEKRTTEIGDQFLAFISDPEKQKKG